MARRHEENSMPRRGPLDHDQAKTLDLLARLNRALPGYLEANARWCLLVMRAILADRFGIRATAVQAMIESPDHWHAAGACYLIVNGMKMDLAARSGDADVTRAAFIRHGIAPIPRRPFFDESIQGDPPDWMNASDRRACARFHREISACLDAFDNAVRLAETTPSSRPRRHA